jgi:putative peptidoglycan lipid II flippase
VVLLSSQYRVEGLAAGTLVGYIGFFLLQITVLKKIKFAYKLNFNYKHTAVKYVAAAILPVTLSVAVNQAYLAVNRIFASGLIMGSITSLDFAYRLMALPLGIFVMAIATAIYPEFSKKAADSNYEELSNSLLKGLNLTALISIPAAVGLIVLRFPFVKFVFERGAFDSLATAMTAEALLYFSIGLFGVGANLVITRAYYSMNNYKIPLLVGFISVILNIVLSFILLPYLKHGGLALANSLAALTSVVLLLYKFKKDIYNLKLITFIKNIFKMFIVSLFMGFVVVLLLPVVKNLVGETFIGLAAQIIISALCGAVIYVLSAYLLRIQELHEVLTIIRKKFKIT